MWESEGGVMNLEVGVMPVMPNGSVHSVNDDLPMLLAFHQAVSVVGLAVFLKEFSCVIV